MHQINLFLHAQSEHVETGHVDYVGMSQKTQHYKEKICRC